MVDRTESDKTGFRSPPRDHRWQQGKETFYPDRTEEQQSGVSHTDDYYAQFRSPRLDQRLWPGGEVLYTLDRAMSKDFSR